MQKKNFLYLIFFYMISSMAATAATSTSSPPIDFCGSDAESGRWLMPVKSLNLGAGVRLAILQSCDFVVIFTALGSAQLEPETFIGGRPVTLIPDSTSPKYVRYVDGALDNITSIQEMVSMPVKLSDGSHWLSESRAWLTVPSEGCYFGPVSHNIRIAGDEYAIDKDGLRSVAVFEFLSKPVMRSIHGCIYAADEKIKIRIKTKGSTGLWMLNDGGYLLLMDSDLFVRLNSRLEVAAKTISGQYAVAEVPDELVGKNPAENIVKMPLMNNFFVGCEKKLNGCSLQAAHDELIRLLKKSNSKGK